MNRFFWMAMIVAATLTMGTGVAPAAEPFTDGGNTCATAGGFYPYGQDGRINSGGDIDYYAVRFSSCGTIVVGSTGTTDTYGYLLDSNCRVIAQNDDAIGSLNFSLSARLNAGLYYVAVRHYSSRGTGAYRLGYNFQPGRTDQCGVCR